MSKKLVPNVVWREIEPLLPKHTVSPKGGRPPVSDRACLTGIVFVLKSGLPWNMLPLEMGCGSGVTCWRRLQTWTQAKVWPELHRRLLRRLGKRGSLRLERAVIDSASMRALFGANTPALTRPTEPKKVVNAM